MIIKQAVVISIFSMMLFLNNISAATKQEVVEKIFTILSSGADRDYIGEPVSQLEHALQCAQLAKNDGADEETIIAALLHDVGHLLGNQNVQMGSYGVAQHERIGAQFALECGFSPKVASLIEGHVQAKRYLIYKNPEYFNKLSPASLQTLKYQGGPMTLQEAVAFEQDPLFEKKLQIRYWDEQAKIVGWAVASLVDYKEILFKNIINT